MNIVRVLVGGIFILSGTILFGLVHLAIAAHGAGYQIMALSEHLSVTKTWAPYIFSIIEILVGVIMMLTSLKKNVSPMVDE